MKDAFQRASACRARCSTSFGGNLGSEILFAITLAIVTRAYGYELPLSTFILINTIVSLFSSVIPVPGGIGVTEAGLTWGLTAAGIPDDTAFAIALTHRIHHVLPAPDLGLHELPVADQAPLPVAGSASSTGSSLISPSTMR